MTHVDESLMQVFEATGKQKRAALIPYVTAGHPHLSQLEGLVAALNDGGADIVEIGIPFSDPLADGPMLQKAATAALQDGTKVRDILRLTEKISKSSVPLVYLTYFNPVYHYGTREFIHTAAASGIRGIIIPDLPWSESAEVLEWTKEEGISLIPLVAPTSTDRHIASLKPATGFIYGVSLTGVTGVRQEMDLGVQALVERVKRHISQPVAIGFGISTPAHAHDVGAVADGVIVGSALVKLLDEAPDHPEAAAYEFVASLRNALEN